MTTKNPGPMYPNLKPWELEPHYCAHASAMIAEGLHSKAAIAEQLAWRDQRLARYEDVVRAAMAFDEGGDFGALTAACARLRLSETKAEKSP